MIHNSSEYKLYKNFFHKKNQLRYPQLQQRQKWTDSQRDLRNGDVVLLKDKSICRTQWPIGRIVNAIKSSYDHVRKVEVRIIVNGKHRFHSLRYKSFLSVVSGMTLCWVFWVNSIAGVNINGDSGSVDTGTSGLELTMAQTSAMNVLSTDQRGRQANQTLSLRFQGSLDFQSSTFVPHGRSLGTHDWNGHEDIIRLDH
jgi:hypothetical protein